MREQWLLAGLASCALTACFPAKLTEQPGFILEVHDRETGAVLRDAQVHFVKVKMTPGRPDILMREFRTDYNGQVTFDRKTNWQLIVAAPEANYSWEWYICVDKAGYLPFANNFLEAKPPAHVYVDLKLAKGKERCSWHATQPFGFNLPGITAFASPPGKMTPAWASVLP
jgi:hypothetical protein